MRIDFRLAGLAGLPALAFVAAVVGLLAGGVSAAATASRQNLPAKPSVVQCPTVDPTTHVVTPAPTSGVDWAGCDLQSANLTNADLDHADLHGAFMENVIFSGANLTDANVGGVTDGSLFVGADASGATFVNGDLTGCDLKNANFSGADLQGVDLMFGAMTGAKFDNANLARTTIFSEPMDGADLTGATLTGVRSGEDTGTPTLPAGWQLTGGFLIGPTANLANENLAGLDLTGADLDGANLVMANLDGATTTGATFAGAQWGDTTCPDGSNSDKYVDGCFSALDTTPPSTNPQVTAGKVGANGWYTSPVTVTWHWTDNGTIDASACTADSTSSGSGDPVKLTATCTDLAGNVGTASDLVKIDTTAPVVVVTGVRAGQRYIDGAAPTPACQSTDTVSKIATPAKLAITTTGSHGVGQFTATCAGAVNFAGTVQARPVTVSYRVSFGFGGFSAPAPGSTIRKSAGSFLASFRLVTASGRPIPSATARWLAAHHLVSVRLSGPAIKARSASCVWSGRATRFRCVIKIPSATETGKGHRYKLAAYVGVGEPAGIVPPLGKAANPEIIHFG